MKGDARYDVLAYTVLACSWLLVVLVVVAVAQRRHAPSSSARHGAPLAVPGTPRSPSRSTATGTCSLATMTNDRLDAMHAQGLQAVPDGTVAELLGGPTRPVAAPARPTAKQANKKARRGS
jgi:hypothetical protein